MVLLKSRATLNLLQDLKSDVRWLSSAILSELELFWENIAQEYWLVFRSADLVGTKPQKILAEIAAKGGSTKYLLSKA